MPKKKGRYRLDLDRVYQASALAEEALPDLVKSLVAAAKDSRNKLADRVSATKTLMSIASATPRLHEDLGLLDRKAEKADSPVMLLLGNNGVSLADFRSFTPEKRREMFLLALGGELPESKVIEVEGEVTDASN